jgi:type VI secretion system protein ImpL
MNRISLLLDKLQRKRWPIELIGIICVSLIIWLIGPNLDFEGSRPLSDVLPRLIIITTVVALWMISVAVRRRLIERNSSKLADGLLSTSQSEIDSKAELQILDSRFREALDVLKKTSQRRWYGGSYLYDLPWYIIIGPPGAGKTTALLNSGLELPLNQSLGQEPVKGIGGTRNCDWWFTNEAVLIDTAGRYTTQDSRKDVDSRAWLGFLSMLRKYRPRYPVNGIIVGTSVSDFASLSQAELDNQAVKVRSRIQELYKELGIQLPIYLVLTKADMMAGFTEFFADLDVAHRKQVWGMTFPPNVNGCADDLQNVFRSEFDLLVDRLNRRLLTRLNHERGLIQRSLINGFPQQVASLKEPISEFLKRAFSSTRYESPIMLRGVYMTSATQEGTPIDRIVSALSSKLGIYGRGSLHHRNGGRSYFIERLLKEVLFAEQHIGISDDRRSRRLKLIRACSYGGIAVSVLGLAFAWSISFTRNEIYLEKLNRLISDYRASATAQFSDQRPIEHINRARDIAYVYGAMNGETPWLMGMGLYQGHKLENASRSAYIRVLHRRFLPTLHQQLRNHLQDGSLNASDRMISLYLYQMLHGVYPVDLDLLRSWHKSDWTSRYSKDPSLVESLYSHLDSMLSSPLPELAYDPAFITMARDSVCSTSPHLQVYARFEKEADALGIAPLDLDRLGASGKNYIQSSSESYVPAVYTSDAYNRIYTQNGRTITSHVLGLRSKLCGPHASNPSVDDILGRVKVIYDDEYASHWKRFLDGIHLKKTDSLAETLDMLRSLDGRQSSLRLLAEQIHKNTGPLLKSAPIHMVAIERAEASKLSGLSMGMDSEGGEFTKSLDFLTEHLTQLTEYIESIVNSQGTDEAAFRAARLRMAESSDAIGHALKQSSRMPAPFNRILSDAALQVWSNVLTSAKSHIESTWRASVLPECKQVAAGRYPFHRSANQETPLFDFGRYFGHGGTLDKFTDTYLVPFYTADWRPRTKDEMDLPISETALTSFRLADRIRKSYFSQGGQTPMVEFEIQPYRLSETSSGCLLSIDGQDLQYRFGPKQWSRLRWPGPATGRARVVCLTRDSSSTLSRTETGAWAWFRLLEGAITESRGQTQYRVEFRWPPSSPDHSTLWGQYDLRTSSRDHPFNTDMMVRYSCPATL